MMTEARIPAVPHSDASIRLINARIFDGTGGPLIDSGEVHIENSRFAYVGELRSNFEGEAEVVDLAGKTVLPGFFDTHVHASMSVEMDPSRVKAMFPEEKHLFAAEILRNTLMAGVTTIRDLGGLTAGFRNLIAEGAILGPRAHLSVSVISPTGGHVDFHLQNGAYESVLGDGFMVVDTDDEMRKTVRELIRSGADVIKVCTTGGVSSPSDTPHDLGVPEHHVRIAVEEGQRRQGQPVTSHAQGSAGIIEAILGGVASVEHGYELDEEGIALMIERGTYLVPTLSAALRVPDPATVPDYLYQKKVVWSQIAREHITRAIAAGVPIALGTDSGICPHGRNLAELGHMVSLGLDPLAAISAGTLNAAKLMRVDHELGSIEVGKIADLVVTEADPLTEIERIGEPSEVQVVIQGGRVVKDQPGIMPTKPVLPSLAVTS